MTSSSKSYIVCLNMKKSKRAASIFSFFSYAASMLSFLSDLARGPVLLDFYFFANYLA